jgi:hypothetical protein
MASRVLGIVNKPEDEREIIKKFVFTYKFEIKVFCVLIPLISTWTHNVAVPDRGRLIKFLDSDHSESSLGISLLIQIEFDVAQLYRRHHLQAKLYYKHISLKISVRAMIHGSVAYISASTNRFNHAADVSSKSLVVFGSSKLVALWDSAVCFIYLSKCYTND